MMKYLMLITVLGFFKLVQSFWPVPYRVELNDRKTFVITAGEDGDENDEESEMIRTDDLTYIVDLVKDEEKYKPLHSHVEHYNRRAAQAVDKYSLHLPDTRITLKENQLVEDDEPFIAGFKHDLDKYNFNAAGKSKNRVPLRTKKSHGIVQKLLNKNEGRNSEKMKDRSKREGDEEEILRTHDTGSDLVETMGQRNHSLEEDGHATPNPPDAGDSTPTTEKSEEYEDENTSIVPNAASQDDGNVDKDVNEGKQSNIFLDSPLATPAPELEENPEDYDYESLRAEYEQQIADAKKSNSTYNITDTGEPEENAQDAIKKIVDFKLPKNCTQEELTKFGAQAFACLAHDYQNAKNHTAVREIMSKTWRVMKIWICIYICIAVPAWCQKGWCCCCFRCSVCFPRERILAAKDYYAHNEPGILVYQPGKKTAKPLKYKPTLFEIDAYEELESAIRNL